VNFDIEIFWLDLADDTPASCPVPRTMVKTRICLSSSNVSHMQQTPIIGLQSRKSESSSLSLYGEARPVPAR
jgi:hypothetical protein